MGLTYPKINAEGVIFRKQFISPKYVADNGGVVTGAPVINNGVSLDGANDYISYKSNALHGKQSLTMEIFFTPNVEYNEGDFQYLFDTTNGDRYYVVRRTVGQSFDMRVVLGNTIVETISAANYSAYWRKDVENHLVVTSDGTDTAVYLNNNSLPISSPAAWTPTTPTDIYAGTFLGSAAINGTVSELSIYDRMYTAAEVADRFNNRQTFREVEVDQLEFFLKLKTHYNNGATELTPNTGIIGDDTIRWGDGNTVTTYPTLLENNGVSFDGGDYVFINQGLALAQTEPFCLGCLFKVTSANTIYIMDCRERNIGDTDDEGFGIAFVTGKVRAFTDAGGAGNWSQTNTTYNDGAWHSCIANYTPNGSDTDVSIYIDGDLKKSETINGFTDAGGAKPVLGAKYTMDANFYVGSMKYPFFWRINVTTTQAKWLHSNFMNLINA